MKKLQILLFIVLLDSCSTPQPASETHEECDYELETDPSGSAKWQVRCKTVLGPKEECSCFEDGEDLVGAEIEKYQKRKIPKRPIFKGDKK